MGRRRAVIAAVAGVLALTVLAGCRTEPGSAAFVGDTRITTSQVNDVLDGYKADGGQIKSADEGARRRDIANLLVFIEIAKRFAAQKNLPAPQPDYAAQAQAANVPASDPWVRLVADYNAYRALVEANAPAVTPTEADYLDAADLLIRQGFPEDQGIPSDRNQIADALKSSDLIATGLAVRNALTPVVKDANVSVNPAFGPAAVAASSVRNPQDPLGRAYTTVILPLTAGATSSPAVVDIPKAE
jgi:hypothetical protein